MNYEPNAIEWKAGDLVIHDADAKRPDMLMVVLRFNEKNRLYTTKYLVNKDYSTKEYLNSGSVLHDPSRFDIDVNPFIVLVKL